MKSFSKLFGLKKFLIPLVSAFGGLTFGLHTTQVVLAAPIESRQKQIVVVDAGHGGPDPGAIRGQLLEKDVNLNIALNVAHMLRKDGIQVCLTRSDDNDLANSYDEKRRRRHRADLQERMRLIRSESPDAVVSIHCNWSRNSSAHGAIVLFRHKGMEGEHLAEDMVESLHREGIKADSSRSSRSLYVLKHTKVPCVLIEVGFLSNSTEAKALGDHGYQSKLASAIESGVKEYLNAKDSKSPIGKFNMVVE
ncbi:N-acetylmuramoyl-L-alanine amidase family protein [Alicyclobacillus ferrooxydans]|uniref:N-acetylmuramoyl-L-alanine amidase family protein n=1 Tax=Alicyclobacillus ferrooxydans TaxID=471514 RepID=UPI0006D54B93|nr:N-acetylmuramoyl-L-alanine amidase [Alicyclobacillus ferrooxydans]